MSALLLLTILACFSAITARAATISISQSSNSMIFKITLSGEFVPEDLDRFVAASANARTAVVSFNSRGAPPADRYLDWADHRFKTIKQYSVAPASSGQRLRLPAWLGAPNATERSALPQLPISPGAADTHRQLQRRGHRDDAGVRQKPWTEHAGGQILDRGLPRRHAISHGPRGPRTLA